MCTLREPSHLKPQMGHLRADIMNLFIIRIITFISAPLSRTTAQSIYNKNKNKIKDKIFYYY